MFRTQEHFSLQAQLTTSRRADRHPAWCAPSRCTADHASRAGGYRSDVGGERRSAPVPLYLITALLPVRDGTAWLSEACAPWVGAAYLHVEVGHVELSMSADYATPVIDALSALLASAAIAPEVTL